MNFFAESLGSHGDFLDQVRKFGYFRRMFEQAETATCTAANVVLDGLAQQLRLPLDVDPFPESQRNGHIGKDEPPRDSVVGA